jgi:ribonuclease R
VTDNLNKYRNEENIITEERHEEIKEHILDLLKNGEKRKLSEEEIVLSISAEGREIGETVSCLDELESEGKIVRNKKGKYRIPEAGTIAAGTVQKTKKGFGFLITDDDREDIFIPRNDLNSAMNGDRVIVKVDTGRRHGAGHMAGEVIRILERRTAEVTGTLIQSRNVSFVVSDDRRIENIRISRKELCGAVHGDKVRAVITKYPTDDAYMKGRIAEIYGRAGDAQAELRSVMRQYGIPEEFPPEVIEEAERVCAAGFSYEGREDLRDRLIITIDGPDAKDLDDAVSVEKLENGNFLLGVHIADVSHYVKQDSKLDKESLKRGCSVYLLDAVVPMLPESLSNGVCSLNQGVDRLTLSMEAEIDRSGVITSYRIFESVIRSSARMVYDDVSDIIENHDAELTEKYEKLCPMIFAMDELAGILRNKRMKGGSLDFDIDESCIELDDEGMPVDIRPAERRIANRIIEEFMLTANQVVAEHYFWMDIPFMYRVHEKPDPDRIEKFKAFAGTLGYSLKGSCDNIHPSALRDILIQAEGSDTENIISRIMLRSMKKADYQPVCSGHFGLGFKYYCHFTSPIRRYPDLMDHRIIKQIIHGGVMPDAGKIEYACDISSVQERNAAEAERTIEKKKKAQFMSAYTGEQFEGIISGVLNSGLFVELPNTVEGYVPVESMWDDYYELDAANYRLVGERTRKTYRMGERVTVKVDKVDLITDEISFLMV